MSVREPSVTTPGLGVGLSVLPYFSHPATVGLGCWFKHKNTVHLFYLALGCPHYFLFSLPIFFPVFKFYFVVTCVDDMITYMDS